MIAALTRLKGSTNMIDDSQEAIAAFKISGRKRSLFSTHPDLDDRINALKMM